MKGLHFFQIILLEKFMLFSIYSKNSGCVNIIIYID
jgi:hypothetical protein